MIKKEEKGFTLIELLIVISVLGILATVVFVALNPLARFQDSRNSRRWADVNAIIGALKLFQVDNGGAYPDTVINDMNTADYYELGTGGAGDCPVTCTIGTANTNLSVRDPIDLTSDLVDNGYLPEMPMDPNDTGAVEDCSRYYMKKFSNGSITIGACSAEQGSAAAVPDISVKR